MGLEIGNIRAGGGTVVSNNIFTNGNNSGLPAILITNGSGTKNEAETVGVNDLTIQGNHVYKWSRGVVVSGSLKPGVTGPAGLNRVRIQKNDFQRIFASSIIQHYTVPNPAAVAWSANRYDGEQSRAGLVHGAGQAVFADVGAVDRAGRAARPRHLPGPVADRRDVRGVARAGGGGRRRRPRPTASPRTWRRPAASRD